MTAMAGAHAVLRSLSSMKLESSRTTMSFCLICDSLVSRLPPMFPPSHTFASFLRHFCRMWPSIARVVDFPLVPVMATVCCGLGSRWSRIWISVVSLTLFFSAASRYLFAWGFTAGLTTTISAQF